MECSKCKNEIDANNRFCPECGNKINNNEAVKESRSDGDISYKFLGIVFGVIVGIIIVLLIIFVPTKNISYEVQVPYNDIEYYTVSEPFENNMCYTAYMRDEIKWYSEINGIEEEVNPNIPLDAPDWYLEARKLDYSNIKYSVKNLEDFGGNFKIYVGFWEECDEGYCGLTQYNSINVDSFWIKANDKKVGYLDLGLIEKNIPSEADAIRINADGEEYEKCESSINIREVQKSRTITKYKTEIKYKKVNWIFG